MFAKCSHTYIPCTSLIGENPGFLAEALSLWSLGKIQNSKLAWGLLGLKFNSPLCLLYNCYIKRNLRLQKDSSTSVLISSAKCRGKNCSMWTIRLWSTEIFKRWYLWSFCQECFQFRNLENILLMQIINWVWMTSKRKLCHSVNKLEKVWLNWLQSRSCHTVMNDLSSCSIHKRSSNTSLSLSIFAHWA